MLIFQTSEFLRIKRLLIFENLDIIITSSLHQRYKMVLKWQKHRLSELFLGRYGDGTADRKWCHRVMKHRNNVQFKPLFNVVWTWNLFHSICVNKYINDQLKKTIKHVAAFWPLPHVMSHCPAGKGDVTPEDRTLNVRHHVQASLLVKQEAARCDVTLYCSAWWCHCTNSTSISTSTTWSTTAGSTRTTTISSTYQTLQQ